MNDDNSTAESAAGQGAASTAEDNKAGKKKYEIKVEGDHVAPETAPLNEADGINLNQALEKLEEAEEAVRKHQDDVLRVQAEMQNLRRRSEQDIEKAHKYGLERFVTELLPVIDNLERALEAAKPDEFNVDSDKLRAIHEGVDLTLKGFLDCFKKFNIEAIDPLGEPFDPTEHQAMSLQENPDVEPNSVTAVMQKGYRLHGRVIRPAMVMVSK